MASGNDDISEFLNAQSSEGTRIDGDESFTIAPEKAWEKMAVHALPFEGAWALELVRAAVMHNCFRIDVKQSTEATVFSLIGLEPWDGDILLESVFEFNADVPRAYYHLAVALRVLSKVEGNPFLVSVGNTELLSWNGERIAVSAQATGGEKVRPSKELRVSITSAVSHDRSFFSKLFKFQERGFMAGVSRVLHERAFCCPIPLAIDTRPIQGMHAHPEFAPSSRSRPLFHFQVPAGDGLPTFRLPELSSWERVDEDNPIAVYPHAQLRSAPQPKGDATAVVLVSAFLNQVRRKDSFMSDKSWTEAWSPRHGPSQLLWVRDGVTVDKEDLSTGAFGLLIVASAEGLKTDLSGYQVVHDEAYTERRRRVLSGAANEVLGVLNSKSLQNRQEVKLSAIDIVLRGVGGLIGMVVVIPGLLFWADLAYGYSKVGELNEECKAAFRREFDTFLERLESYRSYGEGGLGGPGGADGKAAPL